MGAVFVCKLQDPGRFGRCAASAMILNELCTNAVKYGALSMVFTGGRVDITATVYDLAPQFLLRWGESGGPAVVGNQSV